MEKDKLNVSEKFHKCEFCTYRSKIKEHVKRHQEAIHMKVKFSCNLCGYKATEKGSATNSSHSRSHLAVTFSRFTMGRNIIARVVIIRQHRKVISTHMSSQSI